MERHEGANILAALVVASLGSKTVRAELIDELKDYATEEDYRRCPYHGRCPGDIEGCTEIIKQIVKEADQGLTYSRTRNSMSCTMGTSQWPMLTVNRG